jgi:hypothetical protein
VVCVCFSCKMTWVGSQDGLTKKDGGQSLDSEGLQFYIPGAKRVTLNSEYEVTIRLEFFYDLSTFKTLCMWSVG